MSWSPSARRDGVIVVGAGLAGLSAALGVVEAGRRVILLSAAPLMEGAASVWAQGGVAVALSPDDSPALHAADTVAAGAGLVDAEAARSLAQDGPEAVRRLAALGAPFDTDDQGRFLQGLEAAHSRARVARVGGDGAGRAIMAAVVAAVVAEDRIERLEGEVLTLLLDRSGAVCGVEAADPSGARFRVLGAAVILATGGAGGLFSVTTNPPSAKGSGLALAAAAGALISDPEFVQFHPTAMDLGQDPAPLATEALRGEGARLVDGSGRAFMLEYDARGDLASRDVVARAIDVELRSGRGAYLDARDAVGAHFPTVFPHVFEMCRQAGLDPRAALIPVAPAAHYHMGGVKTDLLGHTRTPGLFAVGECASSGVHGANRLASNSLLEAAVFGRRAGLAAASETGKGAAARAAGAFAPSLAHASLKTLREAMSLGAGVVRTEAGLLRALWTLHSLEKLEGLAPEIVAARFIVAAALARRESRGGHYRADHPSETAPRNTVMSLEDVTVAYEQAHL